MYSFWELEISFIHFLNKNWYLIWNKQAVKFEDINVHFAVLKAQIYAVLFLYKDH